MTGYESKRAAARDKLEDDDTQVYQNHPAQEPVAWCSQCGHKCPLPAQEPVAWMEEHMKQKLLGRVHRELLDVLNSINQDKIHHDGDDFHELLIDVEKALAQPKQRPWVDLTDEEIDTTWKKWIGTERANKSYTLAIEAKLKEKNT